jgi:hypothetical protein
MYQILRYCHKDQTAPPSVETGETQEEWVANTEQSTCAETTAPLYSRGI